MIGSLDTLENLRRGGRIGGAQAFFGSLLSIKPVIEVRDGVVEGESRQRTRARSLRYVADKVAGLGPFRPARRRPRGGGRPRRPSSISSAAFYPAEEILVTDIGPVIGAHTGRGTIAVCAQRA